MRKTVQETSNPELWNGVWSQSSYGNSDCEFRHWVNRELISVRSAKIRDYIQKHVGSLKGLKTIEIGSGPGVYSFIFAGLGANVTLLDYSNLALDLAREWFEANNLDATFLLQDALNLDPALQCQYDIAMSFGTAEHFRYPERFKIIQAHVDLVRIGGMIVVSTPNRLFFPHEFLKLYLQCRNKWRLGYEGAFTRGEFFKIARTLQLKHSQIIGSSFLSDFRRYLLIYRSTALIQKFLGLASSTKSISERSSLFDDLFGADLVLLGIKER